jgi:hypothetical protein
MQISPYKRNPLKKVVTNLKFKENCEEDVITLLYVLPNEDMLGGSSAERRV